MPTSRLGQMITFAIELDEDRRYAAYIWVNVKRGDTVQKIASRRGHPEDARKIADLNRIRSVKAVLLHKPKRRGDHTRIRVPGTLRQSDVFHVLAGDTPPRVTGGYQKLDVVERPGRTGITRFVGYDPITYEVPIRFENFADGGISGAEGAGVEDDIQLLEHMAGRGIGAGSAIGPAPIVRISTTSSSGKIVPLIPQNYQWSRQNPTAPLWRIANIDWDDNVPDGVLRNKAGNRIRQKATVTLQQYVRVTYAVKSVAKRAQARKPRKPTKKKR